MPPEPKRKHAIRPKTVLLALMLVAGLNASVAIAGLSSGTGQASPPINGTLKQDAFRGGGAFSNPTPILVPGTDTSGVAAPYPANITVSGLVGNITDVNVTLFGLAHTGPDDIDVLLLGPGGQNAIIMSDVGGTADITGVNLTLDDEAEASLSDETLLTSGTYLPTNVSRGDIFPAPAPASAPAAGSALSIFNGTAPNGTWSLFVVDDSEEDFGRFAEGWSLNFTTFAGGACATVTNTQTYTVATTATPCTTTFTDVDPDNTFYSFIRCLACRGIISGYDDGTFRPYDGVTRGQIAKIVSNAAGFDEEPGPQTYEDVDATNPFYIWIYRLSNRGHIGGYECGSVPEEPCIEPGNRPYFRPNASTTRGQLAKIVANAANAVCKLGGQFYEDVPEDHPFYLWIMRLTSLGVMSGYQCGGVGEPCVLPNNRPYFRPFNNVTRGQASKIIANAFFPGCQTPSNGEQADK
jgi:hypothetical protein